MRNNNDRAVYILVILKLIEWTGLMVESLKNLKKLTILKYCLFLFLLLKSLCGKTNYCQ